MSKKIPVANSPWGRTHERPSDCARWIQQGHAEFIGGELLFTSDFVDTVQRENGVDTTKGKFGWFVADSGGSRLMRELTGRPGRAGISGGHRVLQASHGADAEEN